MKREVLIIFAIVLTIILSLSVNSQLIGKAVFTPSLPSDCSDASIKAVWDSIFKENSSGITILTNTSQAGKCNAFLAYKIKNSNIYYVLGGKDVNNSKDFWAVSGNFTQEYNNHLLIIIQNFSKINDEIYFPLVILPGIGEELTNRSEPIINTSAGIEFSSEFKPTLALWNVISYTNPKVFSSITNETTSLIKSSEGYVHETKKLSWYIFQEYLIQSCAPNWTQVRTSCKADDSLVIWFNDTKSCNNATGKPENITQICDYDGNGVIGNFSSFTQSNLNLQVYINSWPANISHKYNSTRTIEFREGSKSRVKFQHNFSSPLNMKNIIIEKQSPSYEFGYIIVNGINANKTLEIDRINFNSKLCAKDTQVSSISEISRECSSSDEYLIQCPGSNGSLSCSISNISLFVSGLAHSAVREIIPRNLSCTPVWNCTAWSSCSGDLQSRTCADLNSCNITSGKPAETQICVSCNPKWNCTSWMPEKCPKSGNQTRNCFDLNKCNVSTGKPYENQTCTYKPSLSLAVIISISAAIILIALVTLAYILFRKKQDIPRVILRQSTPSNQRYAPDFNQGY